VQEHRRTAARDKSLDALVDESFERRCELNGIGCRGKVKLHVELSGS
jgi:hypothetical protein